MRDAHEHSPFPRARRPGERRQNGSSSDLGRLLESYLHTTDGPEGQECGFAVPRSAEIDDLLRRYVLEQGDTGGVLETSLREHVTRDHPAVAPNASTDAWTSQMAAGLRESVDFGHRLDRYVAWVARRDDEIEAFCRGRGPTQPVLSPSKVQSPSPPPPRARRR